MHETDRDPSQQAEDDEAELARREELARQRNVLQELVASRLSRAIDARLNSGIEDVWREDDDQYNGIEWDDTPPNAAPAHRVGKSTQPPRANRSRIYVNITKPKTDVGVSRVQELLVPNDDKPWEIGPTPVPELANAVESEDQRMLTLADGQQAPAADVARVLMRKAEDASKRMSDQIEDWFVEGRVYAQMRRVIHDAGRIGTGVLKGPVPAMYKDRRWTINSGGVSEVVVQERLAPTSKAISAWDVFPDPSAGEDIHRGAFVIERDYLTGRSVRDLASLPDYDAEAVVEVLKEGPRRGGSSRYDDRYQREKPGQTASYDSDTFETFYYWGDIPPDRLVAGQWVITGLLDAYGDPEKLAKQIDTALQLATVPVVVTLINDRIVRISMNPLETGEFPFDLFVWEPVEGQPWGRGIPRKMAAAQKMLNGATRAMLENAGMCAGPQVIIDKLRIEPADGRYEITGRKLWYWVPGDDVKDVRFAFQVVSIDPAQEQLQNIIKFALEMADHLTNLPLLMQGDMGSAPDTVGGMAMLEANSTSPLKVIAQGFDDRVVVPHLGRYYAWGMQDPAVPKDAKGDMQVRARGASALILRDLYAQVLPQLLPFVKDPDFALDPRKYIEQLLRSNKLNPASLQLTEEEVKAREEAMKANPPVDPKIQAAQVVAGQRAEQHQAEMADKQAAREHERIEHALDRQHEMLTSEIEREIQVLEFAGQREVSLEQIRSMLATKAMDVKNKRELFVAERAFAETTGEGRGL